MWLSSLTLLNFRCFSSQVFRFNSGYNFITGHNGAGKTSLLEGVYYACYAELLRGGERGNLIKSGEEAAFIRLETASGERISVGFSREERTIKINDKKTLSTKPIRDIFNPIFLQQKDIDLLTGLPENRRAFLNKAVRALYPELCNEFFRLQAILKNRKKILEEYQLSSLEDLRVWTEKLFLSSQILQKAKVECVKEINEALRELSRTEHLNFSLEKAIVIYTPKLDLFQYNSFQAFWNEAYLPKMINEETLWKRNLFGGHIDDLKIKFLDQDAKNFASRGQQKMLVLSLYVALAKALDLKNTEKNIAVAMFVDDFLSELDQDNAKEALLILDRLPCQKFLTKPMNQPLLISTEEELVKNSKPSPLLFT